MAISRTTKQARSHRPKVANRHPNYYLHLRETLAANGRTTTLKSNQHKEEPYIGPQEIGQVAYTTSIPAHTYSDPDRFCTERGFHPEAPQSMPQADLFKTFLKWTLDHYPRIKQASTLETYWLQINMHLYERHGCSIDQDIRRDVLNVR